MEVTYGRVRWEKPNGNKIETNDMEATIAYCDSLGWKELKRMPAETDQERMEREEREAEARAVEEQARADEMRKQLREEITAEVNQEMRDKIRTEVMGEMQSGKDNAGNADPA